MLLSLVRAPLRDKLEPEKQLGAAEVIVIDGKGKNLARAVKKLTDGNGDGALFDFIVLLKPPRQILKL